MTITVLSLLVISQVALFQFIAALANKSVTQRECKLLETQIPIRLKNHLRQAPVRRIGLGIILGCLALLPLTGILANPATSKILLLSLAVISSTAFYLEDTRDRVMMQLLAKHTPGGNIRRASLARRSLRQWYHPTFEAVPLVLFVVTLLFLTQVPEFISAGEGLSMDGRSNLLALFGLQGLFVFGSHYYSLRKGTDVNSMATYIPSLRRRPEVALPLGEELAGIQVRYFMFARICIVALLGSSIIEKIFAATGNAHVGLWEMVGWGLTGVMIVGFSLYLAKVGKVSRRMMQESDISHQN